MLRTFVWMVFFCMLTFGCGQNHSSGHVTFHDDGRAKPIVALAPVYDKSCAEVGWSLSEEFTDHIRERLLKQKNIYLKAFDEVNMVIVHADKKNPFSSNIAWMKEAFKNYEYVVFTEIVEHEVYPKSSHRRFVDHFAPSSVLSLTMRIRIFDLRSAVPQVVLQELVHQNYPIPAPLNLKNFSPEQWKKISFHVSPLGFAHSQFIKKVSTRIEEYILLSKGSALR